MMKMRAQGELLEVDAEGRRAAEDDGCGRGARGAPLLERLGDRDATSGLCACRRKLLLLGEEVEAGGAGVDLSHGEGGRRASEQGEAVVLAMAPVHGDGRA